MLGTKLVAWNLRRLRVAQEISQEALAHEAHVDRAYLSSLERGHENPTVDVLDRLATALSTPLARFFEEPKPGETAPSTLVGGRPRRTARKNIRRKLT